ncbi:hypothetical protein C8Q74DRAFT_1222831 [Fomes fomentarius]|nr:hypothetical protein C8Q74DRAFT_1222831 [Fomes fomentarius]
MRAYIETAVVGGEEGTLFSDLYLRHGDGSFLVNDKQKATLDADRPIKSITVYYGRVIEGISVTYGLTNDHSTVIKHGNTTGTNAAQEHKTIKLNVILPPLLTCPNAEGDVIAAVFGRAGYRAYYSRTLVSQIGFFIYNKKTGANRVEGHTDSWGKPFGGTEDPSPEDTLFHFGDVIAFGGFAKDADPQGLSGLTFFKKMGEN